MDTKNLEEINPLSNKILGCALEGHKNLGPGLLESVYENAMCIELESSNIKFECQKHLPVIYKKKEIGRFLIDILVENAIVLELKSTERMDPVYESQILSYEIGRI